MSDQKGTRSKREPEVLVTLVGLVYSGIYLLYVVSPGLTTGQISPFVLILLPFAALFLLLAYGVWRLNRFAFAGSVVLTGIFLFLEGSFALDALSNPSDSTVFFGVTTVLFSLVATFVYSILGTRMFWRKGAAISPRKTIPRSSFFGLIMLGFIIGGLVVGAFAGATQARLLGNLGKQADIVIVQGAGNQGNAAGYYSPSVFTVKVGQTVTWSNGDGSVHTITSDASGVFDSGNVASGATYSYTFTQVGNFTYYCSLHPWMKGTIVVTNG